MSPVLTNTSGTNQAVSFILASCLAFKNVCDCLYRWFSLVCGRVKETVRSVPVQSRLWFGETMEDNDLHSTSKGPNVQMELSVQPGHPYFKSKHKHGAVFVRKVQNAAGNRQETFWTHVWQLSVELLPLWGHRDNLLELDLTVVELSRWQWSGIFANHQK